MRKTFINSMEYLLVLDDGKDPIIHETEKLSTVIEKPLDVILGYDAGRFLRLDALTLTVEDVTEECANAWIDKFGPNPHDEDSTPPVYVTESETWRQYVDDWDDEHPIHVVDPDYLRDMQRDREHA